MLLNVYLCVFDTWLFFFFQLGVVHLEQGKLPEALVYFDKALEIDPEHEVILIYIIIYIIWIISWFACTLMHIRFLTFIMIL